MAKRDLAEDEVGSPAASGVPACSMGFRPDKYHLVCGRQIFVWDFLFFFINDSFRRVPAET